MKFFTVATLLFVSALAVPISDDYNPCTSGLLSNPQCCATDVLGVADLDCQSPPAVPTSANNFASICSLDGSKARCCAIPILDQALICEDPVGL